MCFYKSIFRPILTSFLFALAVAAANSAPFVTSGKVVTSAGAPAPGATARLIVLACESNDVLADAQTTADSGGAFQIAIPDAQAAKWRGVCYSCLLFAQSGSETVLMDTNDDKFKSHKLPLQKTTSITVCALDDANKPVPGAPVAIDNIQMPATSFQNAWGEAAGAPWVVVTDKTGRATIPDVPVGSYVNVTVKSDAYTALNDANVQAASNDMPVQTLHLTTPGSLTGRVYYGASGDSAPWMQVSIQNGDYSRQYQAQADASGIFHLDHVTPGTYHAVADLSGELTQDWTCAPETDIVVKPGANTAGVDVALIKGVVLSGTVTDRKTGKPVTDAQIQIMLAGNYLFVNAAMSHDDGSYRVRLAPGHYSAQAFQPNMGGIETQNDTNFALVDGQDKTVDFTIDARSPVRKITGTVVDRDGNPAVGVTVQDCSEGGGPNSDVTDAHGKFKLDRVRSGDVVVASTDQFLCSAPVTLADGVSDFKLTLDHPDSCARGQVVDQDGKPLANVFVSLTHWPNGTSGGGYNVAQASTDANGRYTLGPTIGGFSYSLGASATGYMAESRALDLKVAPANGHIAVDALKLVALGGSASGIVLDDDDKPVAGAKVCLFSDMEHPVITGPDGRFTISVPISGKWDLRVEKDKYYTRGMEPVSSGDSDVELDVFQPQPVKPLPVGNASVAARVVDQYGKPVPDADVDIYVDKGGATCSANAKSDDAGQFEIDHIAAGLKYHADIQANGYRGAPQTLTGLSTNGPSTVTIEKLDSFVAGTVVDSSGKPAAGGTVYIPGVRTITEANKITEGAFHIAAPKDVKVTLMAMCSDGEFGQADAQGGSSDTVIHLAMPTHHGDGTPANILLARGLATASGKKGVLVRSYTSAAPDSFEPLWSPAIQPVLEKYFVLVDLDAFERNDNWMNEGSLYLRDPKTHRRIDVRGLTAFDSSGTMYSQALDWSDRSTWPDDIDATLLKAAPQMNADDQATLRSGLEASIKAEQDLRK